MVSFHVSLPTARRFALPRSMGATACQPLPSYPSEYSVLQRAAARTGGEEHMQSQPLAAEIAPLAPLPGPSGAAARQQRVNMRQQKKASRRKPFARPRQLQRGLLAALERVQREGRVLHLAIGFENDRRRHALEVG